MSEGGCPMGGVGVRECEGEGGRDSRTGSSTIDNVDCSIDSTVSKL